MKPFRRRTAVRVGLLVGLSISLRTGLLVGLSAADLSGAWAVSSGAPSGAAPDEIVKTEVELTTKDVGARELVLGDLVADAIRAAAKTDAAIIAAVSFHNDVTLPKGNVRIDDLPKALEFNTETIVIVKLTGEQIKSAMEHAFYVHPTVNTGFLQVSGLVVTVNASAEKEKRVTSIKIGGNPLESSKTYRVVMPSTLANGALAYSRIWKKSDIEKETDKTLEAALREYLREHKVITKGEERLVIKGK